MIRLLAAVVAGIALGLCVAWAITPESRTVYVPVMRPADPMLTNQGLDA